MSKTLKEVLERCNKATSLNDVEFDLIENGWGVRYIRIDDVLKIIENTSDTNEKVKHFFKMEIAQTRKWLKSEFYSFFNGIDVGRGHAIELMKKHIIFCEQVLDMLGK